MGAKENLVLHTAWTEAEQRHDLTHHGDFMHRDIEFHPPGGEPVLGLEAYITMMEATYAGLDGFSVVLDDQFATDEVKVQVRPHVVTLDDPVPQREDEQGHRLCVEGPELALPLTFAEHLVESR